MIERLLRTKFLKQGTSNSLLEPSNFNKLGLKFEVSKALWKGTNEKSSGKTKGKELWQKFLCY